MYMCQLNFSKSSSLNNARQNAKLPDWAVLDVSIPPTTRLPAGIANAGFFGEFWEVTAPH
jgi:hypothetical protein